jgi:hypothetical protein
MYLWPDTNPRHDTKSTWENQQGEGKTWKGVTF